MSEILDEKTSELIDIKDSELLKSSKDILNSWEILGASSYILDEFEKGTILCSSFDEIGKNISSVEDLCPSDVIKKISDLEKNENCKVLHVIHTIENTAEDFDIIFIDKANQLTIDEAKQCTPMSFRYNALSPDKSEIRKIGILPTELGMISKIY